jgi:hypothetical protein
MFCTRSVQSKFLSGEQGSACIVRGPVFRILASVEVRFLPVNRFRPASRKSNLIESLIVVLLFSMISPGVNDSASIVNRGCVLLFQPATMPEFLM